MEEIEKLLNQIAKISEGVQDPTLMKGLVELNETAKALKDKSAGQDEAFAKLNKEHDEMKNDYLSLLRKQTFSAASAQVDDGTPKTVTVEEAIANVLKERNK